MKNKKKIFDKKLKKGLIIYTKKIYKINLREISTNLNLKKKIVMKRKFLQQV